MRDTFTVLTLLFIAAPLSAGDWTEFRGPSRQGLSEATGLPVRWSESDNIRWKVPIAGSGWSSPVVKGDRIYLTTAVGDSERSGSDQSLRALCLNANDGQTVWDIEVFRQSGSGVEFHKKNSHASPTPVIDGERIFVHFGPHGTACLRLSDGGIVWRTNELAYKPTHGNGGSPALADGILVISCDGHDVQYVVGLDADTGDIRWKTPRDTSPDRGFSFSTPRVLNVGGRQQAICPGSDAVFSYDLKTGKEIWRVRYGSGYSVVPRPVVGHGLVYICSGFGDKRVLAVDPTGTGDITDTHVRWTIDKGAPQTPSPLLVGDELYIVSDAGVAQCFDAVSGEQHWQKRLGGKFSASPHYADGHIYFQDETGTTTVISAGSEFREVSENHLANGERTFASYAVVDNAILLRSEGHLYRIEND